VLVAPGVATAGGRRGPVVLAGVLAVVSWHTAWNLGGAAGAVAYAALVLGAALLLPWAAARLGALPPAPVAVLAGLGVALLVTAFALGPPPALDHALGVGSDRADALGVALARLADGQYPYAATTYLGNPISPLPGALALAAPFWWLTGDAGTQNVVWLPVLLLVLGGPGAPWRARPTLLWALVALGGLEVLREFLVGDDLVTGVVPALAAVAWTLRVASATPPAGSGVLAAAGIALGVTTCTRPHLALVLVVVVAAVGLRAGRGPALVVGAAATVTWAVLVVPFLLGGTARFSPLHVAAKVTGERGLTAGIVLLAVLALAALLLALSVLRPVSDEAVGWCMAAVLAAPTVLSLLRGTVVGPASDIDLTLGAAAVPFAAWAVASVTSEPRQGWVRGRGGTRPPCDAPGSPTEGTSRGAGGRSSRP
jgi:hypothetical protein